MTEKNKCLKNYMKKRSKKSKCIRKKRKTKKGRGKKTQ